MKIAIDATVAAPIDDVWRAWTTPEDIKQWNAASDDWHTTASTVDLRVGGKFTSRMEAKDGSIGFDFAGTYTVVIQNQLLELRLGDDRMVRIEFNETSSGVAIRETFDSEPAHSIEQKREGWQAILDRFVRYVEAQGKSDA